MRKKFEFIIMLFVFGFFNSCSNNSAGTADDQLIDSLSLASTESDSSLVTCPECGYQSMEALPTEYCLLALDCKGCGATLHPADGDCCVFCTHGTHKCPSMQE